MISKQKRKALTKALQKQFKPDQEDHPDEIYHLHMDQLIIEIRYYGDPYNTAKIIGEATDRFTIESVDEYGLRTLERNPISETGYYSLYINRQQMADFDSPMDFITQKMNYHAKQKAWLDYLEEKRQLRLF